MASSNKGDQGYIAEALKGGSGKSEGITTESIGKGQRIMRAYGLDNVELAMDIDTSLMDKKFGGSTSNLAHSLKGCSAVDDGTGAA